MTSLPLLPMDVAGRLTRLRDRFDELTCEALLITSVVNIRYLTGFSGSTALLLITADKALFTTDGRYAIQCEQQLTAAGVDADIVIGGYAEQRESLCAMASSVRLLGLEASDVSWAQQRRFSQDWFSGQDLIPTSDGVEHLRLVKDDGEIDRIRIAARIADDALAHTVPLLQEAPTEADFALALDFEMRKLGADDVSFATIVASGPNGAKAHHEPSNRTIEKGELIVVDFGALVDGYHSDMTRTLCVGELVDETLLRMVDVVVRSQAAGVDMVKEGVSCAAVDRACREVIDEAGWADKFTHSTGHGVGLDIHEGPAVASSTTATLVAGQVVTVEPGVYIVGLGGVRIEDTVVVTASGCEQLTNAPKDC